MYVPAGTVKETLLFMTRPLNYLQYTLQNPCPRVLIEIHPVSIFNQLKGRANPENNKRRKTTARHQQWAHTHSIYWVFQNQQQASQSVRKLLNGAEQWEGRGHTWPTHLVSCTNTPLTDIRVWSFSSATRRANTVSPFAAIEERVIRVEKAATQLLMQQCYWKQI